MGQIVGGSPNTWTTLECPKISNHSIPDIPLFYHGRLSAIKTLQMFSSIHPVG